MKKIFFTGSLALVLLSSCDKNDDNNNNEINSTDQNFMTQVAIGNKAEIMAGQLAATKGNSAGVRSFGQLMVTEHGQAQSDLQSLATSLSRTLPDSVDAEHQALMTRLNSLSGYSFDTAYINSQVKDHQKTVTLFQAEIINGNNDIVQNYATKYLPHIQMHLQKADSLSITL
jgi:putative membrane protein